MAETPDGKTELRAALDAIGPFYLGLDSFNKPAYRECLIRFRKAIEALPDASPAPDLSSLWALVDRWHADAKVMNEIAHFRDDPYDDVAFVNRNEANRLIACACALAAVLPPMAEGQQGEAGR